LENSGTSLSGTTSTIIAQQGCGTSREYGYVTVKVATNQDLYFAPIFGIDSHGVAAEATAAWGMVVGPPVPVMASIGGPNAFSSCDIPDPTPERLATILMDNDHNGGASSVPESDRLVFGRDRPADDGLQLCGRHQPDPR
jgi:hypothetical protein